MRWLHHFCCKGVVLVNILVKNSHKSNKVKKWYNPKVGWAKLSKNTSGWVFTEWPQNEFSIRGGLYFTDVAGGNRTRKKRKKKTILLRLSVRLKMVEHNRYTGHLLCPWDFSAISKLMWMAHTGLCGADTCVHVLVGYGWTGAWAQKSILIGAKLQAL